MQMRYCDPAVASKVAVEVPLTVSAGQLSLQLTTFDGSAGQLHPLNTAMRVSKKAFWHVDTTQVPVAVAV